MSEIVKDGQWHTTSFDLDQMLRTKTNHHIVDELIFADWEVAGFMKLQFGHNPAGAKLDIDDFTIQAEKSQDLSRIALDSLIIQDFESSGHTASVSGPYSAFCSKDGIGCKLSLETSDPKFKDSQALRLDYNVTQKESYGGVQIILPYIQAVYFDRLAFKIKGSLPENATISLTAAGLPELRVPVSNYLSKANQNGWNEVVVPLRAFKEFSKNEKLTSFSIGFSNSKGVQIGHCWIDDIKLIKGWPKELVIADFETQIEQNLLGGKCWTFNNGAAAITAKGVSVMTGGTPRNELRISYGGSIGRGFGGREFSYCGWACDVRGIDVSSFHLLSFDICGEKSGEQPNIYLDDGTVRRHIDIESYLNVSKELRRVDIPLADFKSQGIDLTHLQEIQVIFEWEKASSTVYLDNIKFN